VTASGVKDLKMSAPSSQDLKPGYARTSRWNKCGSEAKRKGLMCDLLESSNIPKNLLGFIVHCRQTEEKRKHLFACSIVFPSPHVTPHLRHRRREIILSRIVHRNLSRVVMGSASRCCVIPSCSICYPDTSWTPKPTTRDERRIQISRASQR